MERLASSAPFLWRMLCHLLCPAMPIAGTHGGHAAMRTTALLCPRLPAMPTAGLHAPLSLRSRAADRMRGWGVVEWWTVDIRARRLRSRLLTAAWRALALHSYQRRRMGRGVRPVTG